MIINVLFLTKFKCLFNKIYQKIILKCELRNKIQKNFWFPVILQY